MTRIFLDCLHSFYYISLIYLGGFSCELSDPVPKLFAFSVIWWIVAADWLLPGEVLASEHVGTGPIQFTQQDGLTVLASINGKNLVLDQYIEASTELYRILLLFAPTVLASIGQYSKNSKPIKNHKPGNLRRFAHLTMMYWVCIGQYWPVWLNSKHHFKIQIFYLTLRSNWSADALATGSCPPKCTKFEHLLDHLQWEEHQLLSKLLSLSLLDFWTRKRCITLTWVTFPGDESSHGHGLERCIRNLGRCSTLQNSAFHDAQVLIMFWA